MNVRVFSHNEISDIVNKYAEGAAVKDIARSYKAAPKTISKVLAERGVVTQNWHTRKAELGVDVTFFDKTTEASSYFIGLLLADGYISDRGKVSISLQLDDYYILQDLITAANLNSKVGKHSRADGSGDFCQLCFTVKGLSNSLNSLGIVPRKSLKEVVPEKFLYNRHFWRGMVDGDGCITLPKSSSPRVYMCGSLSVCESFLEYCKSLNPDINTNVAETSNGLYRTTICGSKAATVVNELYRDCEFMLHRKYSKALELSTRYGDPLPCL